jgi:hypothetical protein
LAVGRGWVLVASPAWETENFGLVGHCLGHGVPGFCSVGLDLCMKG